MTYDWQVVAILDDACQWLATRYDEAEPGSAERQTHASGVALLRRLMDRYELHAKAAA